MDMLNEQELLPLAAGRESVLSHERIMLYAGANLPSAAAQRAYSAGLSAYPAMGPSFAKEQPDSDLVSRLEVAVSQEVCTLFGAAWAEPRLPSCTFANLAVFHAFAKPGDLLLAPTGAHGGHLSQRRGGTPELAGLKVEDLPFDTADCRLDTPRAADLVRQRRPRLVLLGRSVMVKPDDIAAVTQAAREVGATTLFDASHVAGLIAGGTFPNPLALGVDILTSSTYKTIPGRPHAIIAGRDAADGQRLARLIDEKLIANYDAGKLPSLLVTLREARTGIAAYAQSIMRNTRALACQLELRGVEVIAAREDEIATHQLLIPMDIDVPPRAAMAALEKSHLLVGTCNDPTSPGDYSLRLGTQFITTLGYDGSRIGGIADNLAACLLMGKEGRMKLR